MHHRIIVSSDGQIDKTRVSFPIGNYTTLNDFAGKAVNIGVEWCTPIAASNFEVDYTSDTRHPKSLLSLMNVRVNNQAASWPIETGSILTLLPQYTGYWILGIMVYLKIRPIFKARIFPSYHMVTI